jgi:hypothetical protein
VKKQPVNKHGQQLGVHYATGKIARDRRTQCPEKLHSGVTLFDRRGVLYIMGVTGCLARKLLSCLSRIPTRSTRFLKSRLLLTHFFTNVITLISPTVTMRTWLVFAVCLSAVLALPHGLGNSNVNPAYSALDPDSYIGPRVDQDADEEVANTWAMANPSNAVIRRADADDDIANTWAAADPSNAGRN